MQTKRPNTQYKHKCIRNDYALMSKDNIYKHDYIVGKLSAKYYLKPRTIENIVFNRVG